MTAPEMSFGNWLCGKLTGDWRGRENEREFMLAQVGSDDSRGGSLVPLEIYGTVLDKARAQSIMAKAGMGTMAKAMPYPVSRPDQGDFKSTDGGRPE